jgi:hypothetical protein
MSKPVSALLEEIQYMLEQNRKLLDSASNTVTEIQNTLGLLPSKAPALTTSRPPMPRADMSSLLTEADLADKVDPPHRPSKPSLGAF